jgi:AcrR family transcriptional regulator
MAQVPIDSSVATGDERRRPGRPATPLTVSDVEIAAAKLIAVKGYEATSVRDIAEALDVRKATIYHHVGSKASLLFQIIRAFQMGGKPIMETVASSEGDPFSKVKEFVHLTTEYIISSPDLCRVHAGEFRSLEGEYREQAEAFRDEYEHFFTQLIRDAQVAKQLNQRLDARIAAMSILLMLNSMHEWYNPEGKHSIAKVSSDQITLAIYGISPHDASK